MQAVQQRVKRREREVEELRQRLIDQQKSLDQLCKETGERKARINVNTLRGAPAMRKTVAYGTRFLNSFLRAH